METQAQPQDTAGYYVWAAAGKAFEVHIHLEVIDALLSEIMRGFGAVPKRGAEVGGLLIGSIQSGDSTIVRIEDYEPVACGYTRGPSYLLAEQEWAAFEDAFMRWRPDDSRPVSSSYAVGYYRSHTRDGLSLAREDLDLLDRFFPGPSNVALLVKPFATKAGPAGFLFRENGAFQETTPLEFPFRRRELTGEEPPERRPLTERLPRDPRPVVRAAPEETVERTAEKTFVQEPPVQFGSAYAVPTTVTTPTRSRVGAWMMIPMSFLFLLLGVALGALAELNVGPRSVAAGAKDFSLSLSVLKSGDTLSLRWNADSPLVRKADHGVLEIHDGDYAKATDMDVTQLHNGSIIFRNQTDSVSFRLTVYLNSNLSVSETLGWRK